tara:strand:+ start:164 stop:388 length:225 start_codon:yes stop_codon:yes gene_type:complete
VSRWTKALDSINSQNADVIAAGFNAPIDFDLDIGARLRADGLLGHSGGELLEQSSGIEAQQRGIECWHDHLPPP